MDKIFVIEDGVIKESGNYKDLMQKGSLFLQMHQGNMKPI
jgi:ABC-type multidrug transport system fused ATPase/permease subunit